MVEILPLLGQLGGGGVFVAIVVYLLGSNRADRAAANERIKAAHDRADEAEERARKARDSEDVERRRANAAEVKLAMAQILQPQRINHLDPTAPPQPGDVP